MWRLCLLSETGQNFKYEGSLTSQSENDPLGIASEELRIILSMPELAAFDGKVSEGQLSGKADGQRPPSMQRFVREYKACTHQHGNIADAKWGGLNEQYESKWEGSEIRSLPSSFCFADQVRSRYRKVIACARETTASGLNVVALVLAVIWLLAAQMTALE